MATVSEEPNFQTLRQLEREAAARSILASGNAQGVRGWEFCSAWVLAGLAGWFAHSSGLSVLSSAFSAAAVVGMQLAGSAFWATRSLAKRLDAIEALLKPKNAA